MRILITGGSGQVGHELHRSLSVVAGTVVPSRGVLDLASPDSVRACLDGFAPDVIANAAAFTDVDGAEASRQQAWRANAGAVADLADWAGRHGALLIHYSTDYVFDGTGKAPWKETDPARPLNVYGLSKRAGEEAIERSGCTAIIFRTSWVYAGRRRNFVRTILELARSRERLEVVADQTGAPTAAELVADVTALALCRHRAGLFPAGLYHLAASGETSWCDLARTIVTRARRNDPAACLLAPEAIRAVTTADAPRPARRPANSRLDTTRLQELGFVLPHWSFHLGRCVDGLVPPSPAP